MAHIKGQDVNLLVKTSDAGSLAVIAASKSCDFSLTANSADAAAKDDANPMWDNPAFTYADWSCSNESFLVNASDLQTLLDKVANGDATVDVQFQVKDASICKKGTAIITSLQVSAPVEDFVSVSLSLEGASALTNGTYSAITPVSGVRSKIRGKELMIAKKVGTAWHTICAATGHSLSISVQTSDVKTKDDNELAISKEVTGKSMTLSTDNLISVGETATCIKATGVLESALTGESLHLAFGYYAGASGKASEDWGGTIAGVTVTTLVEGDFLCTSFSASGANKENSTFSAEFQLCGKPTVGSGDSD